MARPKRPFNVGVFGIPAKKENDKVRIKVNVRTDQEAQWKAAKLEPIPGILLIDCPGGAVGGDDKSLATALAREIGEETGGCFVVITQLAPSFYPPLEYFPDDVAKTADLAFWMPIILQGTPKSSDEASDHPWISRAEFEAEDPYRCVSGLGNKGRTGRMMRAAFEFYEANINNSSIFS